MDLVKLLPDLKMSKIVVSEAGASVYSASAFAIRGITRTRRHIARCRAVRKSSRDFDNSLVRSLNLFEQSDIADGDHGLIGKGLQQGNLFIAERMYFGAAKQDRSDARALTQQGNAQISAGAGAARPFPGVGEFVAFGRRACRVRAPISDRGTLVRQPISG